MLHNPPHPGGILRGLWLNLLGFSVTKAALALGISRKTLPEIVNGNSGISPEMAFRLSIAFGGRPESWMRQQAAYDLWQEEQRKHELSITPLVVQRLH